VGDCELTNDERIGLQDLGYNCYLLDYARRPKERRLYAIALTGSTAPAYLTDDAARIELERACAGLDTTERAEAWLKTIKTPP
jgi:hypothetical protein